MERQKRILICENCGNEFEAFNVRRVVRCRECAEHLRSRGQGPRQVPAKGQGKPRAPMTEPGACQLDWANAEGHLTYYLRRFSSTVRKYDGGSPSDANKITDSDRKLANLVAARMGSVLWASVVDQTIEQIGEWDLLRMSDSEWEHRQVVTRAVLARLLSHPGMGVARLTKALHRKRPKLIPICDSVLRHALGVDAGDKADQIIECMDRLRATGRFNLRHLGELGMVSRSNGTELTELRILEVLYWVECGPFRPEQ